jgi:hypothetical protein
MPTFHFRGPVEAMQYDGSNSQSLFAFVKGATRRPSMEATARSMRVYNDGLNLEIGAGDWVVKLGDTCWVLSDPEFTSLFEGREVI